MSDWLKKLALLGLALGCMVSALTSGRFSVRLVTDGALSFVFVPVAVVLGIAVFWFRHRSQLAFRSTLDRLLDSNLPWLWWMTGVAGVGLFVPVEGVVHVVDQVITSMIVPFILATVMDVRIVRRLIDQPAAATAFDILLMRGMSWGLGLLCFIGTSLMSDAVPVLIGLFR